jgi:peptidoglycan hydrolase-like protein with peptidoglycan-binding domain
MTHAHVDAAYSPGEHPHVPAGNSNGGQFAPAGNGNGNQKPPPRKGPAKRTNPAGHKGTTHRSTIPRGSLGFDGQRGTGYGVKGGDPQVKGLQGELTRLHITDAHGKSLALDGKLGPRTTEAVKEAQRRLGMKPTGVIVPAFIARLKTLKALPGKHSQNVAPKKSVKAGFDSAEARDPLGKWVHIGGGGGKSLTPEHRKILHQYFRAEYGPSVSDKTLHDTIDELGDGEINAILGAVKREPHLLKAAASTEPYGDVTYADPGYQADGKKRYLLDGEDHCRAAWSYINQPDNAAKYSAGQLAQIKSRIKAALKRYGVNVSDRTSAAANLMSVELARPGTWDLASGTLTVTAEMLADAAKYAARLGARPSPVKLGHTDPRFTGDGEPAMGWLSNLRVEDDNGPVLKGDITGMPDWLAAAAPHAWPDRSVEGWTDFEAEDGQTYSFVIDGLALLGVTPPGMSSIRSLRDLPKALGVAASARIVARAPKTNADEAEEQTQRKGAGMDPAKIREALGLSADASDDEVKSSLAAAGLASESPPEGSADAAGDNSADANTDAGTDAAPGPVSAKSGTANSGTVILASSVWDETQKTIKSLTAFVDKTKRDERDMVIAKAVTEGKFTPAQKTHFSRLWDADPEGTRALIANLTKNSALAVMASGYAGNAEDADADYVALFGKPDNRKDG